MVSEGMASESTGAYSLAGKRVFVAGHRGMVGAAIMRRLAGEGCEIVTAGRDTVDLCRQAETEAWMAETKPHAVFVAAATVGGILANDTRPAEFLYDNLMIEANLIHAAWRTNVEKLLFLGSSCIYPKLAEQPLREDALLTGPLEPTNQWYAVAKIAGIKMCQAYRLQYGCDFISAMPTNLYGEGDSFDLQSSHVLPALIAKAHKAKVTGAAEMEVWGTGSPRREFLCVDDAADASVFLLTHYCGAGKCRDRPGHYNRRPYGNGLRDRRIRWADSLSIRQAGRNPGQAPRRIEAGEPRLVSENGPPGGNRAHL